MRCSKSWAGSWGVKLSVCQQWEPWRGLQDPGPCFLLATLWSMEGWLWDSRERVSRAVGVKAQMKTREVMVVGLGGLGEPQQKVARRRPDFIQRFSELQGEKGEPGTILTGDIPLERLKGPKVIMSLDPEGTHLLHHPILVGATH